MVHLPRSVMAKTERREALSWPQQREWHAYSLPSLLMPLRVDLDRDIFVFSRRKFFGTDKAVGHDRDKWMQLMCGPLDSPRDLNALSHHWFLRIKNLAMYVDMYRGGGDAICASDRRVLARMTTLETITLVIAEKRISLNPRKNGVFKHIHDKALVCNQGGYVYLHELQAETQRRAREISNPLRLEVLDALKHLPQVRIQIAVQISRVEGLGWDGDW